MVTYIVIAVVGLICGYAFRGLIRKGLADAGSEIKEGAITVAKKV